MIDKAGLREALGSHAELYHRLINAWQVKFSAGDKIQYHRSK